MARSAEWEKPGRGRGMFNLCWAAACVGQLESWRGTLQVAATVGYIRKWGEAVVMVVVVIATQQNIS